MANPDATPLDRAAQQPTTLRSLKAFAKHAGASIQYLRASSAARVILWHQSCNAARFHFQQELPKLQAMLLLGADPLQSDLGTRSGSAMHMASAEPRALPILKLLVSLAPQGSLLANDDGLTPAMVAAYWGNHDALELLSTHSEFGYSKTRESFESPLTLSARCLAPRCVQACLAHMSPQLISEQALDAINAFSCGFEKALDDEIHGFASISSMADSNPAAQRMVDIAQQLCVALPDGFTAAWLDGAPMRVHPDASSTLHSLLEARDIQKSIQANPKPSNAPSSRVRL